MDSARPHSRRDERYRQHSRSRSPNQDDRDHRGLDRQRSPSASRQKRNSHHRKHHYHHGSSQQTAQQIVLPFSQKPLKKTDFDTHKALFAFYLDVQKRLDFFALARDEAKGRWKSFMSKWNRGELAEGWYDPSMQSKAEERYSDSAKDALQDEHRELRDRRRNQLPDDSDDGEGYGPVLPDKPSFKAGPSIPSRSDIQYRQELEREDDSAAAEDLRYARKQDHALQRERLDELAPRSDPGSKERQMEKRRETTAVNREFRDAKESGDVDVRESELMGDDGIEGYKAKIKATEKRKNEREIRKEEILRARAVEREERMRVVRAKEDETMEMLRNIAKQRFG